MLAKLLVCVLVATLAQSPPVHSRRQEYYEDDEDRNIYPDDDDSEEDDDQDEEEPFPPPAPAPAPSRRTPARPPPARALRHPLDCYTCTYRAGQELKACIDPVKYLAYTSTCHSVDDKCFTSVEGASERRVETIVRGCRSACVQSPLWSCCGESRCNNMTYRQPRQTLMEAEFLHLLGQPARSATPPPLPAPTVHFFVSVLLLLHAALRVLM